MNLPHLHLHFIFLPVNVVIIAVTKFEYILLNFSKIEFQYMSTNCALCRPGTNFTSMYRIYRSISVVMLSVSYCHHSSEELLDFGKIAHSMQLYNIR